jgi:hypothetical protein
MKARFTSIIQHTNALSTIDRIANAKADLLSLTELSP